MQAYPFLDTNILLRHLTHDHPEHSPRATALLRRNGAGEVTVEIADIVVFENATSFTQEVTWPGQLRTFSRHVGNLAHDTGSAEDLVCIQRWPAQQGPDLKRGNQQCLRRRPVQAH